MSKALRCQSCGHLWAFLVPTSNGQGRRVAYTQEPGRIAPARGTEQFGVCADCLARLLSWEASGQEPPCRCASYRSKDQVHICERVVFAAWKQRRFAVGAV